MPSLPVTLLMMPPPPRPGAARRAPMPTAGALCPHARLYPRRLDPCASNSVGRESNSSKGGSGGGRVAGRRWRIAAAVVWAVVRSGTPRGKEGTPGIGWRLVADANPTWHTDNLVFNHHWTSWQSRADLRARQKPLLTPSKQVGSASGGGVTNCPRSKSYRIRSHLLSSPCLQASSNRNVFNCFLHFDILRYSKFTCFLEPEIQYLFISIRRPATGVSFSSISSFLLNHAETGIDLYYHAVGSVRNFCN